MEKFILVGGLPRSGTTLLETILGSHSNISMPPGDYPFAEQQAQGLSVEEIFTSLSKKGTWDHWCFKDFSSLLKKDHGEAFQKSMILYANSINKKIPAAKAPYSEFYYETYQEWLQKFELKFIHVIRNPFDAIASFKHSHLHQKAQIFHDAIELQVKNWQRSTSMGLARKHKNPENYEVVHYEQIAENPLPAAKSLCVFLGVEFEENRMLNRVDYAYHDTNTSFSDMVPEEKKGRHIYATESRKHFLDAAEIKLINEICGETSRAMGYTDPDFQCLPRYYMKNMKKSAKIKRKLGRIYSKLKFQFS